MKKSYIATLFALASVVIGVMAVAMYLFWGWPSVIAYLPYTALCMIPAVLKAREVLREEKGSPL